MMDESLFVSDKLHERTVELTDGSKHVLHFKELPAVTFRAFHLAEKSSDEDVQAGSMAKLIAASLCDPDGKPAMSYAKALTLKPAAANALVQEILAVNGFGDKAKNA
jgi:hypothetical protein